MKIKKCTCCGNELPATLEFYHAMKKGKFGVRSVCKKCVSENMKKVRRTPEFREKNRIKQREWVAKNREKAKEINRRSYKKHAEERNAKRKHKYHNDPEFRKKVKERERKYKESGRRYEMNNKPEQREKARIRSKKRRQDPEKRKHDFAISAEWRENNRERIRWLNIKRRENIQPNYVASCMRIKVEDLDPRIYETKKLIIQLKRELKSNNVKIK